MWFVAIGVMVQILNLAGIGPVGAWTWKEQWWIMLAPFVLAILWWAWADWSGLTQRKAMKKVDDKREARRQKALDALGLQSPKKGKR
ncbi:MAG: TIGR04438 family Trp-rich protein [Aquabacterium sp.]|uniref:TIGR04438 family Trp-rich protein n=1 Tax=Aquabacterium sp. TaxID=1872578 RepID=UPI0011FCF7F6|nr:TIGR04438 family Trp-rich protein [Aquabacterium sp.]TAK98094.1 MAG: TIGR04438 family Trp-rich protein [Aquabacterium sp.]